MIIIKKNNEKNINKKEKVKKKMIIMKMIENGKGK